MNSFIFADIINQIMDNERIDLTELALKANADRSYLSKVINSKEEMKVGVKIIGKVSRAFRKYFPENNENNNEPQTGEPTAMQIFHLLAKTLESHGRVMDRIEENMARADAQARIEANSLEILAGVRTLSIRQKQAIAENKKDLAELKSQKHPRMRGSDKKSGQTDGEGKRPDKKPRSGN